MAQTYLRPDGKPRKVAHNTVVRLRGEDVQIVLHNTPVVTYHPDGSFTLATGGWLTTTTKQRMNACSPCYVNQRQGVWHVVTGAGEHDYVFDGDSMTFDANGKRIEP
jgi:hypothetical protein